MRELAKAKLKLWPILTFYMYACHAYKHGSTHTYAAIWLW